MDFFDVTIMEFERGYGSRIDEVKYFRSEELAKNFVKRYNAPNTEKHAPDWYMQAYAPKKVSDIDTYRKVEKAFADNPELNWINL